MGAGDTEWGEWVLADLADTLTQISRLLGNSTEVTWVSLTPPTAAGLDPRVFMSVPERGDLLRLREELAGCGRPVDLEPASHCDWFATIPGLARLRVEADR